MLRRAGLILSMICLAAPLRAEDDAATQARAASAALKTSIAGLKAATSAKDRVAALTTTIEAYEAGLSSLRTGLRRVTFREEAMQRQFDAKRDRIQQLLGVLSAMEATPTPFLLAGPESPLDSIRSGMIVADVTPALQAEAEALRKQLKEVADLQASQLAAVTILRSGLVAVQDARTTLSQAISDRTDLPKRITESPAELKQVALSVKTLGAFADALGDRRMAPADPTKDFTTAKGSLPLPVQGTILRHANEADAAGIRRPGLIIATRPRALVTTPWAATIRYRGPLLDYGNVIILEPGDGYLLVLAGLDVVYGNVGDVIAAGTPVGLMGGKDADPAEFVVNAENGGGADRTETLYMELRQGSKLINPEEWFAKARE